MNSIKNAFVIQDLENLSGIKAHTIRIWEKRYNILQPDRLNRQVRMYDIVSLQKLLNVSILNNYGHKISAIAKLTNEQIAAQAKEIALQEIDKSYAVNTLLLAMFSFDESQFHKVYNEEIKKQSFDDLFMTVYIPLLQHIGILWQTDAIKPAHEHFVSHLIQQKIVYHTANVKYKKAVGAEATYVLYLPVGEIHELGLLFLNYILKSKGHDTVYLGASIPIDNLLFLNGQFEKITWVSGLIVDLPMEEKKSFINNTQALLTNTDNSCWLLGEKWLGLLPKSKNSKIELFANLDSLMKRL